MGGRITYSNILNSLNSLTVGLLLNLRVKIPRIFSTSCFLISSAVSSTQVRPSNDQHCRPCINSDRALTFKNISVS